VRQFTVELEELNHKLMDMGGLVETAIHRAVQALADENRELAEQVIREEPEINQRQIQIDSFITSLFALRQPVARDLRFLTAALKINTDLERMGDLALHIAKRAINVMSHPLGRGLVDIPHMASIVQSMVLKCLTAFIEGDEQLARSVLQEDAEVDRLRDAVYERLLAVMQNDPTLVPPAIDLIFVARHLERIGDHATNIAEDVVFLVKGVDVRHNVERMGEKPA
jgi:phosphate transport system protein